MTLGAFAGLVHLVWEVMIALGWAQGYLDFVLSMHSLNNPYTVQAFNLGRGIMLVVIACVMGYVVGSVFAVIYNRVHK
ncbi:MAG TPA: hypothetical protein VJC13_01680 [Candidatus Paceibacterota bacterium]